MSNPTYILHQAPLRAFLVLATIFWSIALVLLPLPTHAQTKEKGPWWPNEEWGADDQAGASNRITNETVLSALQLAKSGKIYELGQVYSSDMPFFGTRSLTMALPTKGAAEGENRLVANEEFLATQIGQVGTQLDGLGHIGQEVRMADGTIELVFYNGVTARDMDTSGGLKKLGIEHIKPIVTRGVLIDIATYKGVSRLPNSYEVTVDDVLGAMELQGISEDSIQSGDAIFFNYGWSELWDQPDAYNHNPPGIGIEVAHWVAGHAASLIGSDSWTTEVVPNPDPALAFPVHQELMMKTGVLNLENLKFDSLIEDGVNEFLFILTPIPLKGATGSPVRPIAIR